MGQALLCQAILDGILEGEIQSTPQAVPEKDRPETVIVTLRQPAPKPIRVKFLENAERAGKASLLTTTSWSTFCTLSKGLCHSLHHTRHKPCSPAAPSGSVAHQGRENTACYRKSQTAESLAMSWREEVDRFPGRSIEGLHAKSVAQPLTPPQHGSVAGTQPYR